jgi:hypothetical protein
MILGDGHGNLPSFACCRISILTTSRPSVMVIWTLSRWSAAVNASLIFSIANMVAVIGWLALLGSPFFPRIADRIAGIFIPSLIAVTYTGLVLAFWSSAEGGFDSLDNVAALFETRELLLAGWLHYLAFDLFVGAWIVRAARQSAVPFLLVVPCLVLTFLFGPAGLLAFLALRGARNPAAAAVTA